MEAELVKLLVDFINQKDPLPIYVSLSNMPCILKIEERLNNDGDTILIYMKEPRLETKFTYQFKTTKQEDIITSIFDKHKCSIYFNVSVETSIQLTDMEYKILNSILIIEKLYKTNLIQMLHTELVNAHNEPLNMESIIFLIKDLLDISDIITTGHCIFKPINVNLRNLLKETKSELEGYFPNCIEWDIKIPESKEVYIDPIRLNRFFSAFSRFLLFKLYSVKRLKLKYDICIDNNKSIEEGNSKMIIDISYSQLMSKEMVSDILNNINYLNFDNERTGDRGTDQEVNSSMLTSLYMACHFLRYYKGNVFLSESGGIKIILPIDLFFIDMSFTLFINNLSEEDINAVISYNNFQLKKWRLHHAIDNNRIILDTYYKLNPSNIIILYKGDFPINRYHLTPHKIEFNGSVRLLFQQLMSITHNRLV